MSVGKVTVNKITSLASECNYVPVPPTVVSAFPASEQFIFDSVKTKEVESVLKSLANNKAPGIDKIPSHVVKESATIIISPLTSIINTSFTTFQQQRRPVFPKQSCFFFSPMY